MQDDSKRFQLLVFSATHSESLCRSIDSYRRYTEDKPQILNDLVYMLGAWMEHSDHRAFSVTNGTKPLEVSTGRGCGIKPQIVFVFTGQGAQWVGMAKELLEDYPSFRQDIKEMDGILARLPHPPTWTIEDELMSPQGNSRLQKAEISQPLCTAVQIALVNLLQTWGILPAAVVGHSSGEIAAAYTSDAITIREAIIIAYYRGQVTKRPKCSGGMVAVGLGRSDVCRYMVDGVVIACENSPKNVTLSGDVQKLYNVSSKIKAQQPKISVHKLNVEMAYHSPRMRDFGEAYETLLGTHINGQKPIVPFYSSVTGKRMVRADEFCAPYWRDNMESPVLFYSAVSTILNEKGEPKLFLEIGPHAALEGPLRQTFDESHFRDGYLATLTRGKNSSEAILTAIGHLYLHKVSINFSAMTHGARVLTDLPVNGGHQKC